MSTTPDFEAMYAEEDKRRAASQQLWNAGYAPRDAKEDWIIISMHPASIRAYFFLLEELKGYVDRNGNYVQIPKKYRRTRVRGIDESTLAGLNK